MGEFTWLIMAAALVLIGLPMLLALMKRLGSQRAKAAKPIDLGQELAAVPMGPLPDRLIKILEAAGPDQIAELVRRGSGEWSPALIEEMRDLAERNGYISDWLVRLDSPIPTERIAAAEVLTGLRVKAAVPRLVELLRDRVEEVRWTAAAGLESFRDPSVIKPLICLLAEPNRTTPARVAGILLALGQEVIPPLLEAMPRLANVSQALVVDILGQMKSPQVVPGLALILAEGEPTLRAKAAEALGENGDPLALEYLLVALHDSAEAVRVRAARALGQLGSAEAAAVLDQIRREDPSWRVQSGAAEALATIQRMDR